MKGETKKKRKKTKTLGLTKFVVYPDAPETRLVGVPNGQLEEGRDKLEIRCLADANPPASIIWRRTKSLSVTDIASIGETLLFSPVYRNHAAEYICEATNTEGESSPVRVQVSVNCEHVFSIFFSYFVFYKNRAG